MAQRKVSPEEVLAAKREAKRRKMFELGGFLYARGLPDGRYLYLAPAPYDADTTFIGIAQDIRTHSYYAVWEYAQGDDAMWRAMVGWDGEGEPDGYLHRVFNQRMVQS